MAERELSEWNKCRVVEWTVCSVVMMTDTHTHTQRSVAVVEWRESGVKNKYRLGHKGKVGR